jgi:DNA-binding LacI/PurR family transcriptional regulator
MAEKGDKVRGIFNISAATGTPKYRQLVDAVLESIGAGRLGKGDMLPSINLVSRTCSLARETVAKAYKILKQKGAVESRPGKGFYVVTDHYSGHINVFVMFDVFGTPYKQRLYQGMADHVGENVHLDMYFHHYNPELFVKLLTDAAGRYEYYVVMAVPDDRIRGALSAFDQERLLILDIDVDYPGKDCSVIRQDHDAQLVEALRSGADRVRQYERFTLVFPEDRNHPAVIPGAFRRFCEEEGIASEIVPRLDESRVREGGAYLVIEDDDLVAVVKYTRSRGLSVGRDIGFVSYNDTSFKEVLEGGVTVVSVDFHAMGRKAAGHVIGGEKVNILEPTKLIVRNTL